MCAVYGEWLQGRLLTDATQLYCCCWHNPLVAAAVAGPHDWFLTQFCFFELGCLLGTMVSHTRQFAALLQKNLILQLRGRRSILGISGWGALVTQIMLPVAFFSLMCIPKYYIQPYKHPIFLQPQEFDIDTSWWAGAAPYEGPAKSAGGAARIIFVPDTAEVRSLVNRIAMAVSCPSEAYKRICSPASITTFSCLFGVGQAPAACEDTRTCMTNPACHQQALDQHFQLLPDEPAVMQLLKEQPNSMDAVVVFPQAMAAAAAAAAAAAGLNTLVAEPQPTDGIHRLWHSSGVQPAMTVVHTNNAARLGCGAPGAAAGDGLLLDYIIRMNGSDVPPTQFLQDLFDVSPGIMPLPGNMLWEYQRYWFFLNLQLSIDRAILGGQQSNGSYPANLGIKVKPFPWPPKQEDLGAASAAAFFNLLLVYAFMAPTRAVVGSIVREKELRLREGMRILGLSEAAYWWSWSLTHWLTLAVSGLLCDLVGLYPFRHSSFGVMLAFYWLFSAALISFSYFLSTLFSASRVAGTATQFIYALSMIPGFLLPFIRPYGGLSWYLAGLSPTSAASLFAAALVNWERLAAGVTLQTMWLPLTQGSSFCVGSVMWLLAVDVVLFAILTWYFDKVIPTTYGQVLSPWFFLQPSYWLAGSTRRKNSGNAKKNSSSTSTEASNPVPKTTADSMHTTAAAGNGGVDSNQEPHDTVAADSKPYIYTMGLRKVFHSADGGVRVAVEGLDLDIYAGRITALLGHNGAGKTTTIHMLTGMLQPSGGTAYIGSHDITTSMAVIRESLGICPQYDILWPDITVREHLVLYAVIKGATWQQADPLAEQAAAEVGLLEKLSCLAAELSGGQRRKLSVAIAFLGNPAVVFLDEPTSGMDPYSRRATWEIIKRRRHASVIVLTTHSMEEADLLCDEIHIMAEGRLATSGSPLTLKTKYGVGYTLTIVQHKPHHHERQRTQQFGSGERLQLQHGVGGSSTSISSITGSCTSSSNMLADHQQQYVTASSSFSSLSGIEQEPQNIQQVPANVLAMMQLIHHHVPSAVLSSTAGAEVSVRLPNEDAAAFPALLRDLDASASVLGFASYGLSVTTLEEVFLAIADQAVVAQLDSRSKRSNSRTQQQQRRQRQHQWGQLQQQQPDALSASQASPPAAADITEQYVLPSQAYLSGSALYWQQFKGLFVKRMLCARRDRLAVMTQLLVPLLLVVLAMVVSTLQTSHKEQPALHMQRSTCLLGKPALLAAAPSVRQQVEFRGFMDAYPRSELADTQYTQLYHGSSGPALNLTLEGQLLSQWSSGQPHYDAIYLNRMPLLEQLLTSLSEGPVITLLANQSAVSGLPAALSQATTALLRVLVAAGGGKSTPAALPVMPVTGDIGTGLQGISRGTGNNSVSIGNSDNENSGSTNSGQTSCGIQPTSSRGFSAATSIQVSSSSSAAVTNRHLLRSHSAETAGHSAEHAAGPAGAPTVSAVSDGPSTTGASDVVGGSHLPSCLPTLRVSSAPLPLMRGEAAERVRQDAGALMLVLCMTMAVSVLSASFVVYLVREQENNSKHLQLVSGAPPTAYWLSNLCWDLLNFSLPAAGIVLLVWWYNQPQLAGQRLAALAALLAAFGAAGINVTYLLHFLFKDEMKALQRLNTAYFLTGYLGFTATWVLTLIARILGKTAVAAVTARVKSVLRVVSPHYCFAQGLYDISSTYDGAGGIPIPGFQPQHPTNPFAYDVLGTAVAHLLVQAVVFGALAVLLDVGVLQLLRPAWHKVTGVLGGSGHHRAVAGGNSAARTTGYTALAQAEEGMGGVHTRNGVGADQPTSAGSLTSANYHAVAGGSVDDDVAAEQQAVEAGDGLDEAMVVLNGISKSYFQGYGLPAIVAISGLWLRVWPGECFGLLGVNGAGKTTTFKVLTGEVTPDTGDARIDGYSVFSQLAAARRRLGYCPQFEALPSAMTGTEVLMMYARLRGVKGQARINCMAQQLLQQLGLMAYADTVCGAYSGGNKRKLSVAVALVGDPALVLLDEPSTGMDPGARRFLWRLLQSHVLAAGRTILLTSHSMEEVEALASRLAIMSTGALCCCGTPQHLKDKFGDGYTLELRLNQQQQQQQPPAEGLDGSSAAAGIAGAAGLESEQPSSNVAASSRAAQHFLSVLPGSVVLEMEPHRLLLRLPISSAAGQSANATNSTEAQQQQQQQQHMSLAEAFEAVEAARGQLGITEYSLSQSSLERVFLSLAKSASQGTT